MASASAPTPEELEITWLPVWSPTEPMRDALQRIKSFASTRNRVCAFTGLFGGYDSNALLVREHPDRADRVVFSDDPDCPLFRNCDVAVMISAEDVVGSVEGLMERAKQNRFRSISALANRVIKILPTEWLSDAYEVGVYLDANATLEAPSEALKALLGLPSGGGGPGMVALTHPNREDSFLELDDIEKSGCSPIDSPNFDSLRARSRALGVPRNGGMMSGFFSVRNLRDPSIRKLMAMWFSLYTEYGRDQPAFAAALAGSGLRDKRDGNGRDFSPSGDQAVVRFLDIWDVSAGSACDDWPKGYDFSWTLACQQSARFVSRFYWHGKRDWGLPVLLPPKLDKRDLLDAVIRPFVKDFELHIDAGTPIVPPAHADQPGARRFRVQFVLQHDRVPRELEVPVDAEGKLERAIHIDGNPASAEGHALVLCFRDVDVDQLEAKLPSGVSVFRQLITDTPTRPTEENRALRGNMELARPCVVFASRQKHPEMTASFLSLLRKRHILVLPEPSEPVGLEKLSPEGLLRETTTS